MPDWLTKAQATISGAPAAADFQPFERRCVCGETLAGERTAKPQQIVCPNCERSWFVLPRDPYPHAKSRTTKPSLWQRLRSERPTEHASRKADTAADQRRSQSTASIAADQTREATAIGSSRPPLLRRIKDRANSAKFAAPERAKRAARPLRLIGLGIVLAVIGTGLWLWHRARVDAASATIVAVVPQAEEALASHDFATAEKRFADVVAAVDILGANDQTALQMHQRYREIVAINNLAAQTPYDLAAEAEAVAANPEEWSERFRASYAGRWVILDVPLGLPEKPVEPPPDGTPPTPADAMSSRQIVSLDLPLVIGKYPVRFEIDAALFKRLGSSTRAIFAAQYATWRLLQNHDGALTWVVRFKPGTAFLWASTDTYAALGFNLDDTTAPPRSTLARQAKALGIAASISQDHAPRDTERSEK